MSTSPASAFAAREPWPGPAPPAAQKDPTMAIKLKNLLSILGLVTWGDIGPLTCYRNKRGALVFYAKAPPTSPASPAQLIYRNRWRAAATAWNALAEDVRGRWELASKRANLSITGYNLWVYYHTTGDAAAIETIEGITRLDLLP